MIAEEFALANINTAIDSIGSFSHRHLVELPPKVNCHPKSNQIPLNNNAHILFENIL
jgi:hypothetical protein